MKVTKKTVMVNGRGYTAMLIDGECVSIEGSREIVCTWGWRSGRDRIYTEVFFKLSMNGRVAKKVLKALKTESTKVLTPAGTAA
jgi:hypothetical protein